MNETSPSHGVTAQRLNELGSLLALGLTRLRGRQSSPFFDAPGESSLHILPVQSGVVPPCSPEASYD